MHQLNLYLIRALIIAVIALGGGWYISHRISSTEINTLTQRNAVLTSAIKTNEKTIAQMAADAQTLAASNRKLTSRIVAAEMEHVEAWNAIDALDLESSGKTAEIEARANDAFAASIQALRIATGK